VTEKIHFSADSAPTVPFVNMSSQESSHKIGTCLLIYFTPGLIWEINK